MAERFEIRRLAGAGGMGSVYEAYDRQIGATVALKVLARTGASERFAREVSILAELNHPAIVRYIAHGLAPSGEPFLAMEWLEGADLEGRLARGPLLLSECLHLAKRVTAALAAAHEHGVVHRDLKPSNLFLPDQRLDRVKLLDFGIARRIRAVHDLTGPGEYIGTPRYMAPEQVRGARDLDGRVDLFALGCVLFECVTGRAAFPGNDTFAVVAKIVLDDPPRLRELHPHVPEALEELVARLLAKDRDQRPPTATAVAQALALLDDDPRPAAEPQGALTAIEQRLWSVVLLAVPAKESSDPVATETRPEPTRDPAEPLRAVAMAHGGHLEALADGSAAVVFSGGSAAGDQAAYAARCALAMRTVAADPRIAVATGRGVVAGRCPVGEVIDAAAEALRNAAAGAPPCLDPVAAGLLAARFQVRSEGERHLLGPEHEAHEVRTLLGRPTPCVGREHEIALIEAIYTTCVSEPISRAVLVTAPPGVGKSRLRHELVQALRARPGAPAVWMAGGDPMRAGTPYALIGQLIRDAAKIRAAEPLSVRQSKLRARLQRSASALHLRRLAVFLGELSDIPFPEDEGEWAQFARVDAEVMSEQLCRAWEDFVLAETALHPVLVVLEDLHWADSPSVKLVDAALRTLRDAPLMVLALARPDVHDRFPRLWTDRSVQEIRLGGLTRKASERLARAVLGTDAHTGVIGRLMERAGGNALYLEELLRAAMVGNVDDTLPRTVVAMVQARVEGLPEEARRVLRAASVFGEVFWRGGVFPLLGGSTPAAELDAWLTYLEHKEVIRRAGDARFPGEAEYAFRHSLVREAAHGMLTGTDQARGHRLAGAWLEERDEPCGLVLAEHFDRGGDAARARTWYRRAGDQAIARGAAAEAYRGYARARMLADGAADPELLLKLGTTARTIGAFAEGEPILDEVISRCADDPTHYRLAVLAWHEKAAAARLSGRYPDAAARLRRGLALLGDRDEPALVGLLRAYLGFVLGHHLGELENGLREALGAVQLLERTPDQNYLAAAYGCLAACYQRAGRLREAFACHRRCLQLAEESASMQQAVRGHANLGELCLFAGDPEASIAHTKEALALATRMGMTGIRAFATANLASALVDQGDLEAAERVLLDVERLSDRVGEDFVPAGVRGPWSGYGLCARVRIAARRGDFAAAKTALARLIAMKQEGGSPVHEGASRRLLGAVLALAGEHEAAARELDTAARLLDGRDVVEMARLVATRARALARAADLEGAARERDDARRRLGALEVRLDLEKLDDLSWV